MKSGNTSTDDILNDIRNKLAAANEKLKKDAESGNLPSELTEGDSINLATENEVEVQEQKELEDEVILEEKTPEVEQKQDMEAFNQVKQNLAESVKDAGLEAAAEEEWEFIDDEELSNTTDLTSANFTPKAEEFTQANLDDGKKVEVQEAPKQEEHDEIHEEMLEDFEDLNEAESEAAKEELNMDEHEELLEEEHLEDEDLDDAPPQDLLEKEHSKGVPYTYDEPSLQKIPNYSKHELLFESQAISSLTEKIADVLEEKLSAFSKLQADTSVRTEASKQDETTTIKDLVLTSLPPVLEKWISENQHVVLECIERVAERHIAEAILKMKK